MIKSAIDGYMAYRFIRLLTTPWNKTPAFKVGIVDEVGNVIVKMEHQTLAQRSKYDIFDRMIYNLKRLIMKVPLVRSKIGRYAVALSLIKENFGSGVESMVRKNMFEDEPANVSYNIAKTDSPLGGIHKRKNDEDELEEDEPKEKSKKKRLEESLEEIING